MPETGFVPKCSFRSLGCGTDQWCHKPEEHNKNYFKIKITFKHRITGGEYEIVVTHITDCSTDKCARG